jgi:hypothetical protein
LEWINQLKIAVIEKNESKIDSLIQAMPQFETYKEMESAAYLLQEAHTFLSSEKDKIASNLLKIKKQKNISELSIFTKHFLRSKPLGFLSKVTSLLR